MAKIFKAATAGSLPKPSWLAETEKLWPAWKDSGDALTEKKKESAAMWIDAQEQSGIDIISEGEQFRIHFVHGFLETIEGINWDKKTSMGIRNDRYVVEVPTVTEALKKSESIHAKDAKFLRSKTEKLTKFTLPGPMTISDTIANEFYADKAEMAMEFAKLLNDEAKTLCNEGIDVIQFDEPAFNSFLKESIEWGMDAMEVAIDGLECKTAIHICYGYGIEENLNWKIAKVIKIEKFSVDIETEDKKIGKIDFETINWTKKSFKELFNLGDIIYAVSYTHLTLPTILLV